MKLKIKNKVHFYLKKYPHLRDDDNGLIANIWYEELGVRHDPHLLAIYFLAEFADGNLSSPESIRRSRQKIQEDHPELRGEKYTLRKAKFQQETRKELGYNVQ
jgi:hypothetical protein